MTDYPQATQDTVDLVWAAMQRDHTGYENRISRRALTIRVFGKACYTISDDRSLVIILSYDRKLRDALSQLPVVWDDGYFVPTSKEEAKGYIAANRSRIRNLGKKNWIVERFLREQAEPVKVEQLELEV